MRASKDVQGALADKEFFKLQFSAGDMLRLRFNMKHCSMETLKRLRLALLRVKAGSVKVCLNTDMYKYRDQLFKECGVAITAVVPEAPEANGQGRIVDITALLAGIYVNPELKSSFTFDVCDAGVGGAAPPVRAYYVVVDFDGALMTSLNGMVLGFMRTLNQRGLIDDPYMQQLVMVMQGSESRGLLKLPVRAVLAQLNALEKTGIPVDGERWQVRWSTCNDEKMHTPVPCS